MCLVLFDQQDVVPRMWWPDCGSGNVLANRSIETAIGINHRELGDPEQVLDARDTVAIVRER